MATLKVADFPTSAVLDQVDVRVGISHTNVGDLSLFIVSPDGTRVPLALNRGGTSDDLNVTFSDDALTAIGSAPTPLNGTYKPEDFLANFAGKTGTAVNGVWRLEAVNAGGTVGTINNFQLALRAGSVLGLLPGPIPDNAVATALVDVAGFAPGEGIDTVEVFVDATHPKSAQLVFTLVAPDGTRVKLADANGGATGANYTGTIFSDSATRGIGDAPPFGLTTYAPFTGRFRPIEPLSILKGKAPNGTWKLEARDTVSGDVGTLDDFSLRIRTRPVFASADTPKPIPNPTTTPVTSSIVVSGFSATDPDRRRECRCEHQTSPGQQPPGHAGRARTACAFRLSPTFRSPSSTASISSPGSTTRRPPPSTPAPRPTPAGSGPSSH